MPPKYLIVTRPDDDAIIDVKILADGSRGRLKGCIKYKKDWSGAERRTALPLDGERTAAAPPARWMEDSLLAAGRRTAAVPR